MLEILEGLFSLLLDPAFDNGHGRGHQGDGACRVHEAVGNDGLGVWPNGSRGLVSGNVFQSH